MLLTMIPAPSDLVAFDTAPDAPSLLPADATEPTAAFAELLDTGADLAHEPDLETGIALPSPGNRLPHGPDIELELEPGPDQETGTGLVETGLLAAALLPALPTPTGTEGELQLPGLATRAVTPAPRLAVPVPATTNADGSLRHQAETLPAALTTPVRSTLPGPDTVELLRTVTSETSTTRPASAAAVSPVPAELMAATRTRVATNKPGDRLQNLFSTAPDADASTEEAVRTASPQRAALADLSWDAKPQTLPPNPATPLPSPAATVSRIDAAITPQPAPLAATATAGQPSGVDVHLPQPIDVPVRDAAWGEQLGQRIRLMASHKLQSAEIRLTPAELGPIRVQVAVDDGAAHVTFHAQHAVTREALEQAMPRLRDMLAEHGLTLSQGSVGEQGVPHGGRERGGDDGRAAYAPAVGAAEPDVDEMRIASPRAPGPDAIVDTFV